MYARVVRFTDINGDRIADIAERVESSGPPEGVESTGTKLIVDEDQSTAVFVAFFESEEKMKAAAEILEAMDSGETPGTRASVDSGEVKAESDG
jgi:hypothetical protein